MRGEDLKYSVYNLISHPEDGAVDERRSVHAPIREWLFRVGDYAVYPAEPEDCDAQGFNFGFVLWDHREDSTWDLFYGPVEETQFMKAVGRALESHCYRKLDPYFPFDPSAWPHSVAPEDM